MKVQAMKIETEEIYMPDCPDCKKLYLATKGLQEKPFDWYCPKCKDIAINIETKAAARTVNFGGMEIETEIHAIELLRAMGNLLREEYAKPDTNHDYWDNLLSNLIFAVQKEPIEKQKTWALMIWLREIEEQIEEDESFP